jgi:hypothetical protein
MNVSADEQLKIDLANGEGLDAFNKYAWRRRLEVEAEDPTWACPTDSNDDELDYEAIEAGMETVRQIWERVKQRRQADR